MPAPDSIKRLIDTFDNNINFYKSDQYNEYQLRQEFLDPFFEELGWDMDNKAGLAPQYRDVIHEASIKVGGSTKAPDYAFTIHGQYKFFLEAKKPAVNIRDDTEPAYQLRRYGWSAKLPISILTDFEEFAIYDCRKRPTRKEKASASRLGYCKYTDYVEKWDELQATFSKEAILKGSFDKYTIDSKRHRGTETVDDAFLEEIENWRNLLARNFALRNPTLSVRDLNYVVQKTIDRLIFLRICEDRGIEDYKRLSTLLNGARVYPRLIEQFTEADARYNSGLFYFSKEKGRGAPDTITPTLQLDDKVLKEIISRLYYPESPYEFSVLPTEILGQVYERFLGKTIHLTARHQANIEEKPEVRKAGGVYYTPSHIVDYIVKNTLGRLLDGGDPEKLRPIAVSRAADIKVLDPACGSGSFLIVAYQYLIDWHLRQYTADPETNEPDEGKIKRHSGGKNPKIYQAPGGAWRLTTDERKRILINNIFGVDIDSQAVEVTKLSLLLKVIEGETYQINQYDWIRKRQRILPDLGNNIKCGNSLIGPDFYDHQQTSLLDEEEIYRVNAFDWNAEFADIMKAGGFDAVIGNPPYVRQEGLTHFKPYFEKRFSVYHGVADLYVYFIEKGVSLLTQGGFFSYIVANKWFRANYGKPLRQWMKEQHILEIIDFGDLPVFKQATTYPCIIVVQKKVPAENFRAATIKTLDYSDLQEYVSQHSYDVEQDALDDSGWSLVNQNTQHLLDKLRTTGVPLGKYVGGKIYYGIKTGLNEAFVIDEATREKLIADDPKSVEVIKPFLAGRDIKRYEPLETNKYLILFPRGFTSEQSAGKGTPWNWLRKTYPAIAHHLEPFKEKAEKRYDKGEYWWELRACDYYAEFEKPKIIYPNICKKPEFSFDENKLYTNQKCFIISEDDKYLLGVLNSQVTFFLFASLLPKLRGDFYEPSYVYLKNFPIRTINFDDPAAVARHDQIISLVDRMLDLNKKLAEARTPQIKEMLRRQIESTDRPINQLIYELYDLTEEEIKIIESET